MSLQDIFRWQSANVLVARLQLRSDRPDGVTEEKRCLTKRPNGFVFYFAFGYSHFKQLFFGAIFFRLFRSFRSHSKVASV